MGSADQRVRIVRRPARPRRLQHELIARLKPSRSTCMAEAFALHVRG
jgi:hypothetical protein